MKGMKSASEEFIVPPPGRYETEIITAECQLTKKSGASMIHLVLEIKSPQEYAGVQAHDYIITDGTASGGGMGKKKLRGLGIDVDASDEETPDEQIAAWLLGRRLWVAYGNEQGQKKDAAGNYTLPAWRTDPQTQKQVPLMRLTVEEYFTHNAGAAQVAPQAAPVLNQQPLPPQGFAPQQGQLPPQGFVPQQGLPPQGFQVPQGQVPQGQFQGQNPAFNPQQGFAGQVPPGTGPVPGFVPQQGFVPQGAVAPTGQLQQPVLTGTPNGQGGPGVAPPWALAPQAGGEAEGAKTGKGKRASK